MVNKISLIFVISVYALCINAQSTSKPDLQLKKIEAEKPDPNVHEQQLKAALLKAATTEIHDGTNPFPYTTDAAFTKDDNSTPPPPPTPPPTTSTSPKPTTLPPVTTVSPSTSPSPNTTVTPTNGTTVAPTTPIPSTTPLSPTTPLPPKQGARFDFPSFIGGVMLTLGLLAIGFVSHKFYKARTDRNYHTL